VSKYGIMTGSLITVCQVPNGAEEYYFVKSSAQEKKPHHGFSSSKHSYVFTVVPWAAALLGN